MNRERGLYGKILNRGPAVFTERHSEVNTPSRGLIFYRKDRAVEVNK